MSRYMYIFILEANNQAIVNVQAHLYENLWFHNKGYMLGRFKKQDFGGVNFEVHVFILKANNQAVVICRHI